MTAAPSAPTDFASAAPAASPVIDIEQDGNAYRGAFFATLFSLPIWGVLGLAGWGISRLFS